MLALRVRYGSTMSRRSKAASLEVEVFDWDLAFFGESIDGGDNVASHLGSWA